MNLAFPVPVPEEHDLEIAEIEVIFGSKGKGRKRKEYPTSNVVTNGLFHFFPTQREDDNIHKHHLDLDLDLPTSLVR